MFKEKYRKEMNEIAPDPSFIQSLADRMEKEAQNGSPNIKESRSKSKAGRLRISLLGSLTAAAVLCLGVFLFFYQRGKSGGEFFDASLMKENAGGVTNQDEESKTVFNGSSWYGTETDAQKIFALLTNKVLGDEDLTITLSEDETFEDSRFASSEEKEAWVKALTGGAILGEIRESEEYMIGRPVYYLLEFSDGSVIKCAVYDDRYFYCKEIDGIFDLKKETGREAE